MNTSRPRRPAGSRNQRMTGTLAGCVESAASVVEELADKLEELVGQFGDVNFPGMY